MWERLLGPLWRLGTIRGASLHTAVITGSPRSGTTWLLEMVEAATGARRIWEPFWSPDGDPDHRNFGLGWRPYLSPDSEAPHLQQWLGRVFAGRGVTRRSMTGVHEYGRLEVGIRTALAPATVAKFCRAQRLLPWLTNRFDVPVALLIRNPLAVVASQLEHPGWSREEIAHAHPVLCDGIRRDYPELAAYAESLEHPTEKLAATWAFDHLVPLERWSMMDRVVLVPYELVVVDPPLWTRRVSRSLGLEIRSDAGGRSATPSATARPGSHVVEGKDPRMTWRKRLTRQQVGRVLAVCDTFGIDVYSERPMPCRSVLGRFLDGTPRPRPRVESAEERRN